MTKEPKGDTTKLTVEVPVDLWRRAKMRAIDERSDLRRIVIAALEGYLKVRALRRESK
jgi:hypothetical protein